MSAKTVREVLDYLLHRACINCPNSEDNDDGIIKNAISDLRNIVDGCVPRKKDEFEVYNKPGLSQCEADLLNNWDNGYNQAIAEIKSNLDNIVFGKE